MRSSCAATFVDETFGGVDMIGRIRTVLTMTGFGAATLLLAILQLVALKTRLVSDETAPRLWHRLVLKCLDLRVHVSGVLSDKRPLLVAANHVSWTDIMVIGANADVRFIAKAEVSGWPGMGTIARLNRTVFVERERRGRSGEQASEIAARLAGDEPLVLFPEGTTADGNFVLPFKSSLFGAANMTIGQTSAETIHIQPVAVVYTRFHGIPLGRKRRLMMSWAGDRGLWPSLSELLRDGAVDAELHFGDSIPFNSASSRKDTAREVEQQVRAMVRRIQANPRAG